MSYGVPSRASWAFHAAKPDSLPSAEISSTFRSVRWPGSTCTALGAAIAIGTASAAIAATATPAARSR